MEADIPIGWKPLNLEWYDRTTDPDEHLDAFLTQANLYTNDNAILCCVFPMSLKGVALTWYGGLLQGWTTTKHEQDLKDTKRISIGITMRIEEETK
ncbi:hypothetical protein JHK82_027519 [Glycine max]|nr:hypothetical protein JHK82_027519 [Glycine max]KAG5151299.1 hypothetical protein JHK84_027771 [Glycine max]